GHDARRALSAHRRVSRAGAIPLDDRGRLIAVRAHARANGVRLIIFAAHECAAALVTGASRRAARVGRLTALAHRSRAQPANQLFFVDVEQEHDVELAPELRQHARQPLGLRHRAHDTIEHHAALRLRLGQRLFHDAEDDGVGDEIPLVHVPLGFEPLRRPLPNGVPQHVAGGQLGDVELARDTLALRALAGAGRAEQHDVHVSILPVAEEKVRAQYVVARPRNRTRPFFMKPSYLRRYRCCCSCASVSSPTPTTIKSDVPPKRNGTLIKSEIQIGSSAMSARKTAPGKVMRDITFSMYSAVFAPGFTPGMKPPCFFRFSAISIGLKMMAV